MKKTKFTHSTSGGGFMNKKTSITLMILMSLMILLILISCTKPFRLFTFNFITEDGITFATSTVLISFKISDGAVHVFQYILDEGEPATTTLTEISLKGIQAGEHILNLSAVELSDASKTFHFSVNLDGPTVNIRTADREYDVEGSAAPMGRNALIYWNYDTYNLMTQRLAILAYDEEWGRLFILDGEGGFTMASPYTDPTAMERAWVQINPNKRSFYVSDNRVVINDVIYDLFETGKAYNIYIQGQSELGTWGNAGNIRFRLDERYSSDESPVIEFAVSDLTLPTREASGSITITFTGRNIKEYCAQGVHDYFQNDTSQNGELMYMQFGLDLLFDGASLTSVYFPHFREGYDDFSFCEENYWGHSFSKGFVENSLNTAEGTDVLVTVEYALDNRVNDDGLYFVIPYNDQYIRDQNNRTIDGIQVDHSIFRIYLSDGEA